jgi:hypothetical protein
MQGGYLGRHISYNMLRAPSHLFCDYKPVANMLYSRPIRVLPDHVTWEEGGNFEGNVRGTRISNPRSVTR